MHLSLSISLLLFFVALSLALSDMRSNLRWEHNLEFVIYWVEPEFLFAFYMAVVWNAYNDGPNAGIYEGVEWNKKITIE